MGYPQDQQMEKKRKARSRQEEVNKELSIEVVNDAERDAGDGIAKVEWGM